jgi:hypothetical protein
MNIQNAFHKVINWINNHPLTICFFAAPIVGSIILDYPSIGEGIFYAYCFLVIWFLGQRIIYVVIFTSVKAVEDARKK